MKRFLPLLFLSILIAFVLPRAVSHAAEPAPDTIYTEGTLYYTIGNDSITIVGCFGKKEEITVPAMIAGYPVNTIAKGAFTDNKYLKKLNLPDTISKVEEGAIPEGLKVIYNANTDHPQDTPTEIILSGGVLPFHGGQSIDLPPVYVDPTKAVTLTPVPTGKADPTPTAGVTPTGTPAPTEKPGETTPVPTEEPEEGTHIGEDDLDIDDPGDKTISLTPTPSPTQSVSGTPTVTVAPDATKDNAEAGKTGSGGSLKIILAVSLLVILGAAGFVFLKLKK